MKIKDISDDVPMILKKEPIEDKYFCIIHCDECDLLLAKLFAASQGCEIYENFHSLCDKCWNNRNRK